MSLPIPQAHVALVGCTASNLANVLSLEKTNKSQVKSQKNWLFFHFSKAPVCFIVSIFYKCICWHF